MEKEIWLYYRKKIIKRHIYPIFTFKSSTSDSSFLTLRESISTSLLGFIASCRFLERSRCPSAIRPQCPASCLPCLLEADPVFHYLS